jgi:acyl-coenzyme A thioesterase PaaI-like protein
MMRWGLNLFPAFFSTGARATYFDGKFREIHVELPLTWRTRNYVGTIFGGSMFAALDPIYMVMLIERLGREFIVWDKSGAIYFKKPGTQALKARFYLPDELVEEIRNEATRLGRTQRTFLVDLVDQSGIVHARVEKTLVIKLKT